MPSYIIVYSANPGSYDENQISSLEGQVKRLLAEGWQCSGGVSISFDDRGIITRMYQAMIKL